MEVHRCTDNEFTIGDSGTLLGEIAFIIVQRNTNIGNILN